MNTHENEFEYRSRIVECPRCGAHAYEILRSHRHCVDCLYFEINYESNVLTEVFIAQKAIDRFENKKRKTKKEK